MITRTTTQLLDELIDPRNERVWSEFDARYRPILIAFGHRLGLGPEDAADAAQETMTRFVTAYRDGRYDRDRGRLRSWMIGIMRHCILDLHARRAARREQGGASSAIDVPAEDRLEAIWDRECEREIVARGLELLREETRTDPRSIDAFHRVAFDGHPARVVAEEMGMTMNDVYLAKHRCLRRLRTIIADLNSAFEVVEDA